MTLNELIEYLEGIKKDYGGDCEVDVLTETEECQVEQPCGGVAYSPHFKRVKILPEGF